MLLNKDEAVLCNSKEEALQVAKTLEEAGYKMFHSQWNSIVGIVRSHNGSVRKGNFGFRWLHNHEFPLCIATVTSDISRELRATGKITCDEDVRVFSWKWAEELLSKAYVSVEDLL